MGYTPFCWFVCAVLRPKTFLRRPLLPCRLVLCVCCCVGATGDVLPLPGAEAVGGEAVLGLDLLDFGEALVVAENSVGFGERARESSIVDAGGGSGDSEETALHRKLYLQS